MVYHYSAYFSNYIAKIDNFHFAWLTVAVPVYYIQLFLYKKTVQFKNHIKLIIYRMIRLYPVY